MAHDATNYITPAFLERITRFELVLRVWKTLVLPLHYIRMIETDQNADYSARASVTVMTAMLHSKSDRLYNGIVTSRWRDLNSHRRLTRSLCYRYTTPAFLVTGAGIAPADVRLMRPPSHSCSIPACYQYP